MYHANVNVNLMVGSVIQIKSRITTNTNASGKNIKYAKKIIFRILLLLLAKTFNI